MPEKKNKKKVPLGFFFWVLFILLIIVLFFVKKSDISSVLEKTGAKELFSGAKTEAERKDEKAPEALPQINTKSDEGPITQVQAAEGEKKGDGSAEAEKPATVAEPVAAPVKDAGATAAQPSTAQPSETAEKKTVAESPAKAPAKAPQATQAKPTGGTAKKAVPQKTPAPATRQTTLYFVRIDSDGKVLRKEIKRNLPQTDSPLSEALKALFSGTTQDESGKGLRSLVPEGTRLLSATVKDGVATVNVSEEFQFNQFGIEGYLAQLAQVVFTATAFPTVNSVQILVDGQKREYLGAEGVWIGTPLDRGKF